MKTTFALCISAGTPSLATSAPGDRSDSSRELLIRTIYPLSSRCCLVRRLGDDSTAMSREQSIALSDAEADYRPLGLTPESEQGQAVAMICNPPGARQ